MYCTGAYFLDRILLFEATAKKHHLNPKNREVSVDDFGGGAASWGKVPKDPVRFAKKFTKSLSVFNFSPFKNQ